jgi:hypothetical protein
LTTFIPGSTSIETGGAKVAFTQADVGTEAACLAFVNGALLFVDGGMTAL